MRVIPEALVHHTFLIGYWKNWKRRLAFGGALLLCVVTAYLVDHQSYFTAGIIGMLAAAALIAVVVQSIRHRRAKQTSMEKFENAKVAVAAAAQTIAAAHGNAMKQAASSAVDAVKGVSMRSAGAAKIAVSTARAGLIAATQSDTVKQAKWSMAEAAKGVSNSVVDIAKSGITGARDRLGSWRRNG